MSDDYNKENRKYKIKLTKYKTAKALTSEIGQASLAAITFASLMPFAIDLSFPDTDTTGTEHRTELLTQLNEQKQTLMQSIDKFEQQRATINNLATNNEESSTIKQLFKEQKNQLTLESKTFFTDLLTSGSMTEGLDISEQDAENIIIELQKNVGDFDWGKHIDPNIPNIISRVTSNANYLDESRAEHRYDKAGKLSDRFDTAIQISTNTTTIGDHQTGLFFLSILASLLLACIPPITADALKKPVRRMRKPQPPTKPVSH